MAHAEEMRNALAKGYEIEGYRIEKVLGAGGFGVTYLATELSINRRVAIKEYLPNGIAIRGRDDVSVHPLTSGDKDDYQWGLDRFRKEAETLVAFQHPNIVMVFRFFQANGTAYLVMAYVDGESMATILERAGTLSEAELREMLDPLLGGLAHVHEAGFLHRDIKPGNIYIRRDGSPVLLDFGAARLAMGGRSQSLTSIVSAGYAPFEQYTTRGNQGPWSDIYALGGVLYRAAIGQRPPDAPDRIRNDPYVPAATAGQGKFSAAFLAAIDAALVVDEEKRPQTIAEWRPMFEGAAPPAATVVARRPDAGQTLVAGAETRTRPTSPPAPPQAGGAEPSTSWPAAARGEDRTRPPAVAATPVAPRGRVIAGQGEARPSSAKWFAIIGIAVFALAGAAAGAYFIIDSQRKAELEKQMAEARNAIARAASAIASGKLDEAEREIAEAERLAPKLPEIGDTRTRLEEERRKRTTQDAIQRVRQLIDQARDALRRRDFAAAEKALNDADELAKRHQLAAFVAEIARVRAELEAARRRPPDTTSGTPSTSGGPPVLGGSWPRNAEMRRAVDDTIRRIAPRGY
jgi:hypothetical protein